MARKTLIYTEDAEGRDKGKMYLLAEMPATAAEWWAVRAFLALGRAGVEIPDDIASMGLQGIAIMGISALGKLNPYDAKPLLDEMMECIKAMPDPNTPNIVRDLVETDIEEVKTRLKLRKAVFNLHCDFFTKGSPSNSAKGTEPGSMPTT